MNVGPAAHVVVTLTKSWELLSRKTQSPRLAAGYMLFSDLFNVAAIGGKSPRDNDCLRTIYCRGIDVNSAWSG